MRIFNVISLTFLFVMLIGNKVNAQENALDFDGTDDYIVTANNIITTPTAITVEFWTKMGAVVGTDYAFSMEGAYNCKIWSTGDIQWFFDGGSAGAIQYGAGINDGAWHHIAATNDGITTNVYIDGVWAYSQAEGIFNIASLNRPTGIGAVWDGSSPYLGNIDELRIWNDVRTAAEIANNMCDLDNPASEANLLIYYEFNETVGTNLPDVKSGFNGTLTNMTNADWVAGVTCGSPAGVSTSLELWMKADKNVYNSGSTLATDGQSVNSWMNKSILTGSFDQSVAAEKPTFRNSGTGLVNYNPSLQFDGTADVLDNSDLNLNTDATLFGVWYYQTQLAGGSFARSILAAHEGFGGGATDNNGYMLAAGRANDYSIITMIPSSVADGDEWTDASVLDNNFHMATAVDFSGTTYIYNDSHLKSTDAQNADVGTFTTGYEIGGHEYANGANQASRYYMGYIAEIIAYDGLVNQANRLKIHSYLGVKYGITLDNTGGGIQGDYVASDATNIWDASNSSTYHNDVIGIGRDDDGDLEQLQSHTNDDVSRMYVGTLATTNKGNTGTITNDISYILMGDNSTAATLTTSTEKPQGIGDRITREWKVTNTNFTDSYSCDFTLTAAPSAAVAELRLLVDTDGDFTNATVYGTPDGISFNISGNTITVSGISTTHIASGNTRYITIGKIGPTPGAVSNELELWLKGNNHTFNTGLTEATDGQNVETWGDQCLYDSDFINTDGTEQPVFRNSGTGLANYNPTLEFDGTSTVLENAAMQLNTDATIIAVWYNQNQLGGGSWSRPILSSNEEFAGAPTSNLGFQLCSGRDATTQAVVSVPANQQDGDFWDSGVTKDNQYHIYSGMDDNATTRTYCDDYQRSSDAQNSNVFSFTTGYQIGANEYANAPNIASRYYLGYMAEIIAFDDSKSAADRNKVNSYLGIKYSITLDNTGGGTQGDYTATDGTLLWDASVNSTYHSDIIGIGRDDDEVLNQKQSRTIDDTSHVYISTLTTTNALNVGSFANDISYLVVGDNGGQLKHTGAAGVETPVGCGLYSRLEREWKVTKTNLADNFHFDTKLNSGAQPGLVNISHLRLLVDDDGDFSNGGTTCYFNGDGTGIVISYSNPVITVSNISATHISNNSTRYLTIGSIEEATPLPTELTDFNIDCIDGLPNLTWVTATEINNQHFTIERSSEGLDYSSIAYVDGIGNSLSETYYSWIDSNPENDINYYRLKQTDFNGEYKYLGVKVETCKETNTALIFPNPFENYFNIRLPSNINYPVSIEILNCLGQKIYEQHVEDKHENLRIEFNDDISVGTYYAKIYNLEIHFVEKILKLK